MATHVALLRGINVGRARQIPMARLREVLTDAGLEDPFTHLRSGNVIVRSSSSPAAVATSIERAIEAEWGFEVPVIVRSRAQLAKVVAADPFGDVATDPSRYLVMFLPRAAPKNALEGVDAVAYEPELVTLRGKELYAWLPEGQHDSKLMKAIAESRAGLMGTVRNWRTVMKLLELASD